MALVPPVLEPIPPLTLLAFTGLGSALLLGLWRPREAALLTLPALGCALAAGHLTGMGALWLSAGALLALQRAQGPERLRGHATALLSLLVLPLGLHLLPGFHNPKLFAGPLSALSPAFILVWNLDKACAGLLLLVGAPPPEPSADRRRWAWAGGLLALVVLVALGTGRFAWDPKLPGLWPAWLLANLCFVCIPEEVLFRMTLQPALERSLGSPWMGLGATSLLFGLVHAPGGLLWCLLATLAGLAYGLAYQVRRVPWHPVALHLGLNALHFLCFAYPGI